MLDNMIDEFKRSPMAVISGTVGIIVGALSLSFAAAQINTSSTVLAPSHDLSIYSINSLNVSNLLLIIAFFLSSAFTVATIIRIIARKHNVSAFFLSIPVVALIDFLTILVIYLAPPRQLNRELFISAHDLVLYSSIVVFLTICGKAVLKDIAISQYENKKTINNEQEQEKVYVNKEESTNTMVGVLFVTAIMFTIWFNAVYKGQMLLTHTFLPEITYPNEKKENNK